MKYLILLFFVTSLVFAPYPRTTHAYVTTDQNEFSVNGEMGIFTIDFKFGHEKYDVYIPVQAVWGDSLSETALSYSLHTRDGNNVPGSAVGIVLGNAPVKDGMYIIPKGKSVTFTLLVIYTSERTVLDTYTLSVAHLPFSFNGTNQLKLNLSELRYYVTNPLELVSQNF